MWKRVARVIEVPARAWCRVVHPDPMWPVSGYYRCPSCLRQYAVPWEELPAAAVPIPVEPVRAGVIGTRWDPKAIRSSNIQAATAS